MKRFFLCLICIISLTFPIYAKELYVSGQSCVIRVNYNKLYVLEIAYNKKYEELSSLFKKGDFLIELNGNKLEVIDDLYIYEQEGDNELLIERDGKPLLISIDAKYDMLTITKTISLQDHICGIGTLTFATKDQRYVALGHPLSELIVNHVSGDVYETNVYSIIKSRNGFVGEKKVDTSSLKYIGNVSKQSNYGIFGTLLLPLENKLIYESASKEEVIKGRAYILTQIDENEPKLFAVDIIQINKGNEKGIKIKIVDNELLSKTGGIIQGMSGSPIIQNDKIVGILTHVIVDQSNQGYGIFIEDVLEEMNDLE